MKPHTYGGPHGVPAGLERCGHGSYRWHRGMEAVLVVALIVVTAPWMVEIAVGAGLMALGLLWLGWRVRPGRWHHWGLLGVLLAVVALVEARKRP